MPPDESVLRFLIDSVLAVHDGCCLDEPADRVTISNEISIVLTEYLAPVPYDGSEK